MADDYGRDEWQKDAAAARAEALRRIAAAAQTQADTLDLSDLTALTALPAEIGTLTRLKRLFAGDRRPGGAITPFSNYSLTDITPLSGLPALATLDLSGTRVADLAPLAGLPTLATLDLSGTRVADLAPLSGLPALATLVLSGTPVTDLAPLSGLPALATLDLSGTPVTDLAPLAGLPALAALNLTVTRVADLTPLAGLPALATLNLSGTRVADLIPLAGIPALATLRLNGTPVADLAPLSGLPALATLDLTRTPVADLAPLAGLPALATLNLIGTPVADLAPLSGLPALATLDLSDTQVADLAPLPGLPALATLVLSGTQVADLAPLSGLPALAKLYLRGTQVADLTPLLTIRPFAEERAEYLNFQDTPAADPARDRRLDMLSRLDGRRCAVETVQYLRGTHPDFRDPPGGPAPRPLAERLAAAAPVGFAVQGGQLATTNPGAPERLAPRELSLRLTALRAHVAALQEDAQTLQVPRRVITRLAAYAAPLQSEEPTYILLDGPMSFLRGGADDRDVTRELDGGFVAGWQKLVEMHDALRPLLLPPEEDDTLPPLAPAATPYEGMRLTDQAIAVAEEAEGPGGTDASVAATLRAAREYFEVAAANQARRPGLMRRGVIAVAGTIGALVTVASSATAVAQWLTTPQGQAFLSALRPIYEALKALFV